MSGRQNTEEKKLSWFEIAQNTEYMIGKRELVGRNIRQNSIFLSWQSFIGTTHHLAAA